MKKVTFKHVEAFDFSKALYDTYKTFHIRYRRKYAVSEVPDHIKRLIDGEVEAQTAHGYQATPFFHYHMGDMAAGGLGDVSRRGRYTFGGYDFTVISTTNDVLGALAMKFMSSPHIPGKMSASVLNQTEFNGSRGQTLIIDHATQKVYSAEYTRWGAKTVDGVDTAALWAAVPDELNKRQLGLWCKWPGMQAITQASIHAAYNDKTDTRYEDVYRACKSWHVLNGKLHPNQYVPANQIRRARDTILSPAFIRAADFTKLDNYERATIATLDKPNKPRKVIQIYSLDFDNKGYFEAIAAKMP